ncbi:MAG: exopolygalacturonase, partial [Tidjanibacter sp.]|nr:exopolygalacturonase [Tidjanibacter sp.]
MKKILIALMSICLLAGTATAKENKKNVFPDGTPIPEWFDSAEVPDISTLGKIYNLADYGVISDPVRLQTEKVQAVIDEAAANGGGVVVFPEGICKSGALFMKQG